MKAKWEPGHNADTGNGHTNRHAHVQGYYKGIANQIKYYRDSLGDELNSSKKGYKEVFRQGKAQGQPRARYRYNHSSNRRGWTGHMHSAPERSSIVDVCTTFHFLWMSLIENSLCSNFNSVIFSHRNYMSFRYPGHRMTTPGDHHLCIMVQ